MTAYQLPDALGAREPRTTRSGFFWINDDLVTTEHGRNYRAPLYVEWEAPVVVTRPLPLVLVHGGGGQITDWRGTPDGRDGWMQRFVDAGYAVFAVDRPAHGRSWNHPDVVGAPGAPFTVEAAKGLFTPGIEGHTQAVWGTEPGDAGFDQLAAGMGFLPHDLAESHRLDQVRLAALLDRIGPAVLVTHSAGGPAGWLALDARPDLVRAVVAIEPMGPQFSKLFEGGDLVWGLTASPLAYDPPVADPATLEATIADHRLPSHAGKPVVVVVGEASPFAAFEGVVVEHLQGLGADARLMNLGDHGVHGNGHAPMLERNSDDAIEPILAWIDSTANAGAE
ncbi:alpha/beta hydrolase [Pseudoclavibacter endophyticus]|uniref:Alpha/beta fold hydrolase n=1 Tax=Pseudoclavibacter endophyticus TaxID=1778590 RepID=A0A6H9WE70_9MICO|nr:alpha/beta fold hydrolase [Pseudoclavibacter endophyticus]KAB1649179.1 alpha/beta fold hydrolase [Pseudoclavibacter endophyticus]GGA64810.1 alpha/beta hydrolase [Pseudoclavibacter endophyticus]